MTSESMVERKILQCVDNGLEALGNSGKKAIYYHLKKNFRLKKEEIPRNPKALCKGLTAMFGEEGADVIEKWIVEKLRMSFYLRQPSKITFAEAVAMIKARQKKLPR